MTPFLITGLPRSRTAWLAHLFTVYGSWCEHEPSYRFETLDDLGRFYAKGMERGLRMGASDHGLGWWLPEIVERFGPRVLLVERDIAEVYASLRCLGLPEQVMDYLEILRDRQNVVRAHPNVLCVPFNRLDDKRTIERTWFHLLPGIPFDEARFEHLRRFRVELTEEWIAHLESRGAQGIYKQCAAELEELNHA